MTASEILNNKLHSTARPVKMKSETHGTGIGWAPRSHQVQGEKVPEAPLGLAVTRSSPSGRKERPVILGRSGQVQGTGPATP